MRIPTCATAFLGFTVGCLLTSCDTLDPEPAETPRAGAEAPGALRLGEQHANSDSALQPGSLATVRAAPVEGWTGPGGRGFEVALRTTDIESGHARRFGNITRRITLRGDSPDLVQYPCTSCHLGRTIAMRDLRIGDAHQNIQPSHPSLLGAVCSTCHSPAAVDMLALKTGERVGLDHSYRLCAQCHFSQAEAWAGGSHGKRLDGWRARRVVMGCADCHDPHRPAVTPRLPFRAPTIQRSRGHAR